MKKINLIKFFGNINILHIKKWNKYIKMKFNYYNNNNLKIKNKLNK